MTIMASLVVIGAMLIFYSLLFLQTTTITSIEKYDRISLPYKTYISIPIYLNSNDKVLFNYTTIPEKSNITILLSDNSALNYIGKAYDLSNYIGRNYTYKDMPGKYYLLLINNAGDNITVEYSLLIYKQRTTEKYHGLVSITGSFLVLIGISSIFYLKMKELTGKYPDHTYSAGIECWSTKLYKHRCNIVIPAFDSKTLDIVDNVLRSLGYTMKRKLSETIIVYEKKTGLIERFRKKPVELLITFEEPYLTIYYDVWPIVASGSKDLDWILKEAEAIRNALYTEYMNSKNKISKQE
ncbi:hypothetical protein Shell_0681 [Staphylothermus hellenicus DSM 12710]|uniref:Uncharacterized protein n=2 Tax=Staphylothermus hellenicus TaxID=84599 RepID=D7DCA7_STAHD|nr:hypothetical protein Shell_0681 [Staphylothermus hellenicus DSM 12710]